VNVNDGMDDGSAPQRFAAALDGLVDQVKGDRSILAAILCGSLSHDTVWAKSDIDLILVTIDDRKIETSTLALDAEGVNVHAILVPRAR
jgi:predicted nucleotidyltransferase